MSLMIENVDDLRQLMKQLGVKVQSAAELQQLLASINACYNPDAARVRTIKLTCLTIPSVSFSIAGLVSFFVLGAAASGPFGFHNGPPYWIAGLAIIWGGACLATIVSTIFGFVALMRVHRALKTAQVDQPPTSPVRGAGARSGDLAPTGPVAESSSRFILPRD